MKQKLVRIIAGTLLITVPFSIFASVLVEDDFAGSAGDPPNADKFDWGGQVGLNGAGQLGLSTDTANTSWIKSKSGAALAPGLTLVAQFTAYAYAEGTSPGIVYGDKQPRGLRAGTDANNVVEFYSASRTTLGMRTRRDGVETTATFSLPVGVDSMHQYEIAVTTTSAVFRVDGALAATITDNLPTGSLNYFVSTYDGGFGNVPVSLDDVQLSLSNAVTAIAPTAATASASNIIATGTNAVATLNGTVNPNGANTTAWFEWGRTRAYGNQNLAITVTSNAPVSALVNVPAGFPYHFRTVASNSAGCSYGADQTFWSPRLQLTGAESVTNAYGVNFVEPGVAAKGAPLAIATGFNGSAALKADGSVAGWGQYSSPPAGITNAVAICAGDSLYLALLADGTITNWGLVAPPPAASNVVSIAAGRYHGLALQNDGTIVGWGNNTYGQLDIPSGLTNVASLAAGGDQSAALKLDGTVTEWGQTNTPVPADVTNAIALAVGAYHVLALKPDGTVTAWGYGSNGQTNVPADLTNAIAVAAAGHHSMAMRSNGRIAGWGWNPYGELSPPSVATNMVAISTGYYHSMGLRADGTVLAWGLNNYNQTVVPTNLMDLSFPIATQGTVDCFTPGAYTLTYWTTNQIGAVATATRTVVVLPPALAAMPLQTLESSGSGFHFAMTNTPGTSFTVLCSTNVSLPLSQWTVLGSMVEAPTGRFQFTDPAATNRPATFYRLRSP